MTIRRLMRRMFLRMMMMNQMMTKYIMATVSVVNAGDSNYLHRYVPRRLFLATQQRIAITCRLK
jgi:hypothetical protein